MNTIIGHTGFVGLNLCEQINFKYKYNSENIHKINNIEHDIVYCCGISGNKFWANKNSVIDKENIENLICNIKNIKCNKLILISTIDVYKNNINKNENDFKCDDKHHPYGWNRYWAELEFKKIFNEKLYIVRLPALFGNFLKKNIIFDLLNNIFYSKINLDNVYQFYYLSNLSNDIKYVIDNNIDEINLSTEPIKLNDIVEKYFKFNNEVMFFDERNGYIYNLKTKYSNNGYWQNKNEVLNDLDKWLKKY